MLKKKWVRVIGLLMLIGLLFDQCIQQKAIDIDPRGSDYAGADKCIKCHVDISNSYSNTAHNISTSVATRNHIAGSFHADSNRFQYNDKLKVMMEERNGQFYQIAFQDDIEKASFPFDIVVGSGRKAQTFLYWYGTNAFQLPITYSVAAKKWVNSPNYPNDRIRFDRMVPVGCFECHSSFIEKTGVHALKGYRADDFNPNKIVYGIDCERCHGPAAQHVNYQTEHPLEKLPKYIISNKKLNNIQQLENCASCHSGIRETVKSPFNFKPGELLSAYFKPNTVQQAATELDVHGNQYQLLLASKCFKGSSEQMTCASCHNPHKQERNNFQLLSTKCMTCHPQNSNRFCSFADKVGPNIVSNCIDCHMPASPSKIIGLRSEGKLDPTPNLVFSHLITIYPDISNKLLVKLHRVKK